MTRPRTQSGLTLIEVLVSLALLTFVMAGVATLLLQSARANRGNQLALSAQASVRNSLAMIAPVLRSAGWDPRNAGIASVVLDGSGNGNFITARADLNGDLDTLDANEDVTIRFNSGRIEWRTTSDVSQPFVTLAEDITNDADGDGTPEPMFTPDSVSAPKLIRVKITARSPVKDPRSNLYIRATDTTDIVLRRSL